MERDIEFCVKDCADLQSSRKMPPVVPLHPWARPDRPWSRVHIDFVGPFEGTMFLLLIDAHSKWLEVPPIVLWGRGHADIQGEDETVEIWNPEYKTLTLSAEVSDHTT